MSKNITILAQDAKRITVLAPADVLSGALVIVGGFVGIAIYSALSGAPVVIERCCVATLAKKSADVFTQGMPLYWDATPGELTLTDTGNVLVGHAYLAYAGATTSAEVLLLPSVAV